MSARSSRRRAASQQRKDKRQELRQWKDRSVTVLQTYAEVARPIMLQYWKPHSCVAATRVTMDVLGAYGITAKPVCVSASLQNAAFMDLVDKLGRWPTLDDYIDKDDKAWAVGIGVPEDEGGDDARVIQHPVDNPWNGHLVAVALNDTILLDASIDQASRPAHDMTIPPEVLLMGVPPGFLTGDAVCAGRRKDGMTIAYTLRKDGPTWEDTPDWQPGRWGMVELGILRAMMAKGVTL